MRSGDRKSLTQFWGILWTRHFVVLPAASERRTEIIMQIAPRFVENFLLKDENIRSEVGARRLEGTSARLRPIYVSGKTNLVGISRDILSRSYCGQVDESTR